MHDFLQSMDAVRKDADLRAQLVKCLKSEALASVNHSDLVSATFDLANVAIREAALETEKENMNRQPRWSEGGNCKPGGSCHFRKR